MVLMKVKLEDQSKFVAVNISDPKNVLFKHKKSHHPKYYADLKFVPTLMQ